MTYLIILCAIAVALAGALYCAIHWLFAGMVDDE